jgi:hypothetical protein
MTRHVPGNNEPARPGSEQCHHCGDWYETQFFNHQSRGFVCGNCFQRYGEGAARCPSCHGSGC